MNFAAARGGPRAVATLPLRQRPLSEHVRRHALSETVVVAAAVFTRTSGDTTARPKLFGLTRKEAAPRGWLQRDEGATGSSDTLKPGSPGNAH